MSRHVSGVYQRTDRVRVQPGALVRLRTESRHSLRSVTLIEFSLSDMLLASSVLPSIGAEVGVTIALRDRHIEFELPGIVAWHRDDEFAITFEYLSARQTYGLALALELARQANALSATKLRAARNA
ncbi:MAG TPA: PilZ domain-containing protein [Polyangiaceae bacterium]|nr:PilZ domain-containing protein [Polyangiaceae bacterium]